jgi:choline dehydrogenase-like flavoprotein
VDLDPAAKDSFGIPKLRIHFHWGENELSMWEHSKKACADLIRAAGGVVEDSSEEPETPGYSQHEIGTCRMGDDPKKFVTNRFGQTHDVANLFICDGSVFVNGTDKAPTLSILAFALRTSEYLIEQIRRSDFFRH